jgi:glucokinase
MNTQAIGIDVGGTKIAAGLVGLASGRVDAIRRVPTPVAGGGEAVLAACVELANDLDGAATFDLGIAVPELVGLEGQIQSAYQFDWREIDVRSAFAGREITIASDVRAAARAEAMFGAGAGASSMLYVSVGTGISSTFVLDGTPWPGARGHALVLSSGDLATIDSTAGVVVHSALEDWASGPALVNRYQQASGRTGVTTRDVLELASQGDPTAAPLVENAADALGSAIGQAANVLDPELVVIGGGLGLAGGAWWERIVASARRSIWSEQTRDLPIVTARLGTEAGLIGAAMETRSARARLEQQMLVGDDLRHL